MTERGDLFFYLLSAVRRSKQIGLLISEWDFMIQISVLVFILTDVLIANSLNSNVQWLRANKLRSRSPAVK